MSKGNKTADLLLALALLALAGCSTLQYEGGVNKQPTPSDYPGGDRVPPPIAQPSFRF